LSGPSGRKPAEREASERESGEEGAYHRADYDGIGIPRRRRRHPLARRSSLEGEDDLDVDLESGILTITCADDTKIIVNRQTPNREIWVAARSGGFHFRWREGEWRDTRSGDELFASSRA
jgi:iron donor protein CyaY